MPAAVLPRLLRFLVKRAVPDAIVLEGHNVRRRDDVSGAYPGERQVSCCLPHALRQRLVDVHARSRDRDFATAVRDFGMSWNSLGVGFPRGWNFSSSLMRDVLEPHFLYTGKKPQPSIQRTIVNIDHRKRVPLGTSPNPWSETLSRDGYVSIDKWDVDIDALSLEVEASLTGPMAKKHKNAAIVYDGHLRSLEPLLKDSNLLAAAAAYLGGDAKLTGYQALRLHNGLVSTNQYTSCKWHHDRCGS